MVRDLQGFQPNFSECAKGDLRFMYLNLTNKCNLRCLYCYDENSREIKDADIPLEIYQSLAEDCRRLGMRRICLTGGEPFLNRNWYQIAGYFRRNEITVTMSSNGTVMTDDTVKKLKELNIDVQISLDGNEEVMNFVTGRPFAFKRVLEAVKLLRKYDIRVTMNAVIGQHNLDSVEFMHQFSMEYGVVGGISPYNHIFNEGKQRIHPLTIEQIDQLIWKVAALRKVNKKLEMNLPPLLTPEGFDARVNPYCGWACHVCGILCNGDVTVCALASSTSELIAGNIQQKTFYEIWTQSMQFKKLRELDYHNISGICAECPVLDKCRGFCRLDPYIRYKDFYGPNYLCQQYYEAMLDGRIPRKEFPSKMLELA